MADKLKQANKDQENTGATQEANNPATVPYVKPVMEVTDMPVAPTEPAPPEAVGSRRLAAEQEAGRRALEKKYSPAAVEAEKNPDSQKGKKK